MKSGLMRILLGSLAGGVVLLAWVILSFGILPFRESMGFRQPTDDVAVHQFLTEHLDTPGVYESLHSMPEDPELRTAFLDGPRFTILHPGGGHRVGLLGSLLSVLVILLAPLVPAIMMSFSGPGVQASYLRRVAFIAGFGLFLAIFSEPFEVGFGGQPPIYAAFLALHDIVGWTLVGTVVGAIVRPCSGPGK